MAKNKKLVFLGKTYRNKRQVFRQGRNFGEIILSVWEGSEVDKEYHEPYCSEAMKEARAFELFFGISYPKRVVEREMFLANFK